VGFAVNLVVGVGVGLDSLGFFSIGVTFVALRIGGDSNGWSQLD